MVTSVLSDKKNLQEKAHVLQNDIMTLKNSTEESTGQVQRLSEDYLQMTNQLERITVDNKNAADIQESTKQRRVSEFKTISSNISQTVQHKESVLSDTKSLEPNVIDGQKRSRHLENETDSAHEGYDAENSELENRKKSLQASSEVRAQTIDVSLQITFVSLTVLPICFGFLFPHEVVRIKPFDQA